MEGCLSSCGEKLAALGRLVGSLELVRSFRSWKVKFLKWEDNRAAHGLAQFANVVGSSQQWTGVEPPLIRQVLLVDRAKS